MKKPIVLSAKESARVFLWIALAHLGGVVFPLFSSSVRPDDKLGTIVDEESKDLAPLAPLETTLDAGNKPVKRDVSVRLHAKLTEVGTMALALKSVHDKRTWEIHLNVRSLLKATVGSK